MHISKYKYYKLQQKTYNTQDYKKINKIKSEIQKNSMQLSVLQ